MGQHDYSQDSISQYKTFCTVFLTPATEDAPGDVTPPSGNERCYLQWVYFGIFCEEMCVLGIGWCGLPADDCCLEHWHSSSHFLRMWFLAAEEHGSVLKQILLEHYLQWLLINENKKSE